MSFLGMLFIALGAASGALSRFFVTQMFSQVWLLGRFPIGVFLVNFLGSFCIGLFFGNSVNREFKFFWSHFLKIGFLGSFTTFSAFSEETYNIARQSNVLAAVYVVLSVGLSILSYSAGNYLSFKLGYKLAE